MALNAREYREHSPEQEFLRNFREFFGTFQPGRAPVPGNPRVNATIADTSTQVADILGVDPTARARLVRTTDTNQKAELYGDPGRVRSMLNWATRRQPIGWEQHNAFGGAHDAIIGSQVSTFDTLGELVTHPERLDAMLDSFGPDGTAIRDLIRARVGDAALTDALRPTDRSSEAGAQVRYALAFLLDRVGTGGPSGAQRLQFLRDALEERTHGGPTPEEAERISSTLTTQYGDIVAKEPAIRNANGTMAARQSDYVKAHYDVAVAEYHLDEHLKAGRPTDPALGATWDTNLGRLQTRVDNSKAKEDIEHTKLEAFEKQVDDFRQSLFDFFHTLQELYGVPPVAPGAYTGSNTTLLAVQTLVIQTEPTVSTPAGTMPPVPVIPVPVGAATPAPVIPLFLPPTFVLYRDIHLTLDSIRTNTLKDLWNGDIKKQIKDNKEKAEHTPPPAPKSTLTPEELTYRITHHYLTTDAAHGGTATPPITDAFRASQEMPAMMQTQFSFIHANDQSRYAFNTVQQLHAARDAMPRAERPEFLPKLDDTLHTFRLMDIPGIDAERPFARVSLHAHMTFEEMRREVANKHLPLHRVPDLIAHLELVIEGHNGHIVQRDDIQLLRAMIKNLHMVLQYEANQSIKRGGSIDQLTHELASDDPDEKIKTFPGMRDAFHAARERAKQTKSLAGDKTNKTALFNLLLDRSAQKDRIKDIRQSYYDRVNKGELKPREAYAMMQEEGLEPGSGAMSKLMYNRYLAGDHALGRKVVAGGGKVGRALLKASAWSAGIISTPFSGLWKIIKEQAEYTGEFAEKSGYLPEVLRGGHGGHGGGGEHGGH